MTYSLVVEKLSNIGIGSKGADVANKLTKKKFSAAFFFAMFKHYYFMALVLGLNVAASNLAGQEVTDRDTEAEKAQGGAIEPQYQGSRFSIPVQIIEDQKSAVIRERSEDYSRNLQERGLVVQERTSLATQSIEDATWWMLWVSIASTLFVAIGTGLLVWTLRLTRQANCAALSAVEVTQALGEAQLRAYVDLSGVTWISHWRDGDQSKIFWRFTFSLKNTGATPTKRLKVQACMFEAEAPIETFEIPEHVESKPLTLGSGAAAGILTFDLDAPRFDQVREREVILYVLIEVTYGNAINPRSNHITRIGLSSGVVTGDPTKYWHATENPVSIKFNHIKPFNCVDDECY